MPAVVRALLAVGKTSFYEERAGQRAFFDSAKGGYVTEVKAPKVIHLPWLHKASKVVLSNPGASLLDLGDGVACLEFHTKMNVIGGDQLGMLERVAGGRDQQEFRGPGHRQPGGRVSAGANLLLLTTQIQNQDWDKVDLMIRTFQKATSPCASSKSRWWSRAMATRSAAAAAARWAAIIL